MYSATHGAEEEVDGGREGAEVCLTTHNRSPLKQGTSEVSTQEGNEDDAEGPFVEGSESDSEQ